MQHRHPLGQWLPNWISRSPGFLPHSCFRNESKRPSWGGDRSSMPPSTGVTSLLSVGHAEVSCMTWLERVSNAKYEVGTPLIQGNSYLTYMQMVLVKDLVPCPLSEGWRVAKPRLETKDLNSCSSAQLTTPWILVHDFCSFYSRPGTSIVIFSNSGKCINVRGTQVVPSSNL